MCSNALDPRSKEVKIMIMTVQPPYCFFRGQFSLCKILWEGCPELVMVRTRLPNVGRI